VLLWGEDVASRSIPDHETERVWKELLAEVLLSIRHYIAVNEPAENLTFQKIRTWILKPLMFALRLERLSHIEKYPLTITDLLHSYETPPQSVLYFCDKKKWDSTIQSNRDLTLHSLHDEVSGMLMM
jgi:hypothetical protein